MKKQLWLKIYLVLFGLVICSRGFSQEVVVKVEKKMIKTYPYFDPNPTPFRGIHTQIYPYFPFDGYSHNPEDREWTVVTLENPYIKLFILPEVGGKVWGAIEKATQKEFVYLNEVLKFRNIAMRGPWTSGGIEFNFGLIGHSPWTASAVDYIIQENRDGSKSCIIGSMDLSARTQWRVNINLAADQAYFTTGHLWYNPMPFPTSYYHWMNGAFLARDDFKLIYPGNYTIGHGGQAGPWPVDETGRDISLYKNNNFGENKSYHVINKYTEFSGGYWQELDFGFGHWGYYDDLPGQKFWMWSLARQGAIWEQLLTDTDGQYVEVQMGRMLNQASANSGYGTPFTQFAFTPITTDRWSGIWFPINQIGGMVAATPFGVMNVTRTGDTLAIGINALQTLGDELVVSFGDKRLYATTLNLAPMAVYKKSLVLPPGDEFIAVQVGVDKLFYTSDPDFGNLNRPVISDKQLDRSSAESLYQRAEEYYHIRDEAKALEYYLAGLEQEVNHSRALNRVAEIYCRRMEYDKARDNVLRVLAYNTYDPAANFIYGVICREQGQLTDAKAASGLAARSMQYRTSSYEQIAEIYIQEGNDNRARVYANRALDYDQYNIQAMMVHAIASRGLELIDEAETMLHRILAIDPLNHWARYELYLLSPNNDRLHEFSSLIRNEFPHETYLEIAIAYATMGLNREAIGLLKTAPTHPMVFYWLAYLSRNDSVAGRNYLTKAITLSPYLVFPFRRETVPVLKWALESNKHWKTHYYLGLIYWNLNRMDDAVSLFNQCGNNPDYFAFYLTRSQLLKQVGATNDVLDDLLRAYRMNKDAWLCHHMLGQEYLERLEYNEALQVYRKAFEKFPDNFVLGMAYATSLLRNELYGTCIDILDTLTVLPYEGASEGHDIYEQAYLLNALDYFHQGNYTRAIASLENSKAWPERLGVGMPYHPDNRLQDYLIAHCYQKMGKIASADSMFQEIYHYTRRHWLSEGWNHYIGALILQKFGETGNAERLLTDWSRARGSDFYLESSEPDRLLEWARAKFANNTEKIISIEKKALEQSRFGQWDQASRKFITLIKAMHGLAGID